MSRTQSRTNSVQSTQCFERPYVQHQESEKAKLRYPSPTKSISYLRAERTLFNQLLSRNVSHDPGNKSNVTIQFIFHSKLQKEP